MTPRDTWEAMLAGLLLLDLLTRLPVLMGWVIHGRHYSEDDMDRALTVARKAFLELNEGASSVHWIYVADAFRRGAKGDDETH